MNEEVINKIDVTTTETNSDVKKLSDDVIHGWRNIKENRERIAIVEDKTKSFPELMTKFYHLETVISKGNGSPSLISVVNKLDKENTQKTTEMKALHYRMKEVEEDTKSNSSFRDKMSMVAVILAIVVPIIINKFF